MSQPGKPLAKIAPKPSTSGLATTAAPAGKFVIIQGGSSLPVKVVNVPKPGTSSSPVELPRTKFIVKNGVPLSVKSEKPQANVMIGPASAITIGKKPDGQTTMVKVQRPEPSVVKVVNSPQSTNYHKVNIPGKGVQVVRLLNSQAPGTSQASTSSAPKQLTRLVTPQSQQQHMQQRVLNDGSVVVRNLQVPQRTFPPGKQQMIQRMATQPEKKYITIHSGGKQVELVKKEPNEPSALRMQGGPPAKKTKYITLTTSQINQIQGATIMSGNGNKKKIVMLPANYIEQLEKLSRTNNINSTTSNPNQTTFKIVSNLKKEDTDKKKRACNCTRSQCLKFYCDCFANGEFCQNCNCKDCQNVEESSEREKAVKLCLERNPMAFKPKIQADKAERAHTKGCNCKRSGCLKNYCECYEGKIQCSDNCRCLGCKNVEDVHEKQIQELNYLKISNKRQSFSDDSISDIKLLRDNRALMGDVGSDSESMKKPYNFMTQDVIEATVQCMIAQGEECQKLAVSKKTHEKMILEEFGRCLVEIIDFSNKNLD